MVGKVLLTTLERVTHGEDCHVHFNPWSISYRHNSHPYFPVRTMSILLYFPIDLACAIVLEWLRLKDLSCLDMAHCNKEQRPVFLESLSYCVMQHLPNVRENILLMDWLTSRKMCVRELSIYKTTLESCLTYLRKYGKAISSVTLHEINMSNQVDQHLLTTIHVHCSNLTSVVCIQCKISESVLDILRHCTNLKHFAFVNCIHGFTSSFLTNHDAAPIRAHVTIDAIGTDQTVLSEIQRMSLRFCIQRLYVCGTDCAFNGMQGTLHMLERSEKNVRCLGFSRAYSIPDSILMQTISYCPNILHLDISLCRNLTDASLDALARHLTQLRSINVSCCSITNLGLSYLAQHQCDTLQALFASECHAVTGAGFNAILQNCHQLHTLGFNLVPQIINTLDGQLLRNIRTLQTDLKCEHEIARMLQYFTRLENLYMGNYFVHVLLLPATNAPALRNVILGVANSYSHGNSIVFGYNSSLWSHQHDIAIAALQAQRPNLRVRFELGNDWPSNFMKLPV